MRAALLALAVLVIPAALQAAKVVSADIQGSGDHAQVFYLNGKQIYASTWFSAAQGLTATAIPAELFQRVNLLAFSNWDNGDGDGQYVAYVLRVTFDDGTTARFTSEDENAGHKVTKTLGKDVISFADWMSPGFDDGKWSKEVYVTDGSLVTAKRPLNPETGLGVAAIATTSDGSSTSQSGATDYFRRVLTLWPAEAPTATPAPSHPPTPPPSPTATPVPTAPPSPTTVPTKTPLATSTPAPIFTKVPTPAPRDTDTPSPIPTKVPPTATQVPTRVPPTPVQTKVPPTATPVPPTPTQEPERPTPVPPSPTPLPPQAVPTWHCTPVQVILRKSLEVSPEKGTYTFKVAWNTTAALRYGLRVVDSVPPFLAVASVSDQGRYNRKKNTVEWVIKGPLDGADNGEVSYVMKKPLDTRRYSDRVMTAYNKATAYYDNCTDVQQRVPYTSSSETFNTRVYFEPAEGSAP